MKGKNTYLALALVPVLFLSGCKWFGDKKEAAKPADPTYKTTDLKEGVLAVWGDGTPLLTQKEFDEVLDFAMKEQPELQGLAEAFLPMLKKNLFNTLVTQKIISKWVEKNNIDKTEEYKAKLKKGIEAITLRINVDYFSKQFDHDPTPADLKDYYEKNKDRVALVSKGGIKAAGVKFDSQADAKAFLTKAKAKIADFEKLAKADEKLAKNLQDFNYVNKDSRQLVKALRDKILALTAFPTVILVKADDNTFWVVKATEKTEDKYRMFDELKEQIENMVRQTKQNEEAMKKLEGLKAEYGVKVDEDAFAPKQQPQMSQMMKKPVPSPASKKGKKPAAKAPVKPVAKAA